ncbi:di-trans,poly-cis-decaprenylcistransferase [Candidatus Woesearchaeota archaeon]|nr:di-trans,poly-cis-decaprenylcistransferase [Candidatus Woesearchaeota archaeon]
MDAENYPKHIGIILDGNRRWARQRGKMPWDGHRAGFNKLKDLFKWVKEIDIKELSLYCFSTQNFKRDKLEVDFLMNIFEKAAKDVLTDKSVHNDKVKVRFIGRLHLLPEKVQKAAKAAMESTKNYNNYIVNFCVAYGGREEIADGVRQACRDVKSGKISPEEIDEESFRKYLYLQNDPDIIIRTSGEHRLSNFLTWHSTYSEWFFLEKHWPDFSKEDLVKTIKEFQEKRSRRFGK